MPLAPPSFDEAQDTDAPLIPPSFDEADDTEPPLIPPAFDEAQDTDAPIEFKEEPSLVQDGELRYPDMEPQIGAQPPPPVAPTGEPVDTPTYDKAAKVAAYTTILGPGAGPLIEPLLKSNPVRAAVGGASGGTADIVGGGAGLVAEGERDLRSEIEKREKRLVRLGSKKSFGEAVEEVANNSSPTKAKVLRELFATQGATEEGQKLLRAEVEPYFIARGISDPFMVYRTPAQEYDYQATKAATEDLRKREVSPAKFTATDLQEAARLAAKDSATFFGQDPKRQDEFLTHLAAGAGSLPPYIASSMAGGPVLSMMIGSLQTAQNERNAAIESGHPEKADEAFNNGLMIGLTEGAGVGAGPAAAAKGFRQKAFTMLKKGAEEGGQEWVQNTLTNLNAAKLAKYDPDRPLLEGSGEAALIGFFLGTGVEGASQVSSPTPDPDSADGEMLEFERRKSVATAEAARLKAVAEQSAAVLPAAAAEAQKLAEVIEQKVAAAAPPVREEAVETTEPAPIEEAASGVTAAPAGPTLQPRAEDDPLFSRFAEIEAELADEPSPQPIAEPLPEPIPPAPSASQVAIPTAEPQTPTVQPAAVSAPIKKQAALIDEQGVVHFTGKATHPETFDDLEQNRKGIAISGAGHIYPDGFFRFGSQTMDDATGDSPDFAISSAGTFNQEQYAKGYRPDSTFVPPPGFETPPSAQAAGQVSPATDEVRAVDDASAVEQATPAALPAEPLSTFDKALQDERRAYRKEVEGRPVEQQPPRMWYELEAARTKGIGPQEITGDEVRAYQKMWQNAVDTAVAQGKPVFAGGKYAEKPPKRGWTRQGDLWQPPAKRTAKAIETPESAIEYARSEGLTTEAEPIPAQPPAGVAPEGDADTQGTADVTQPDTGGAGTGTAPTVTETPVERARRVVAERQADLQIAREEGDTELAESLSRVLGKLRKDLATLEKAAPAPEAVPAETAEIWQRTREQVGGNLLAHREAVKAAVKAGQPVPDDVLAEYAAYVWGDTEIKRRRRAERKAAKGVKTEAKTVTQEPEVVTEPAAEQKPWDKREARRAVADIALTELRKLFSAGETGVVDAEQELRNAFQDGGAIVDDYPLMLEMALRDWPRITKSEIAAARSVVDKAVRDYYDAIPDEEMGRVQRSQRAQVSGPPVGRPNPTPAETPAEETKKEGVKLTTEFDKESGESNYKVIIPKAMIDGKAGAGRLGGFVTIYTPRTKDGDYIVSSGYARTPQQALDHLAWMLQPERAELTGSSFDEHQRLRAEHEAVAEPIRVAIAEAFRPIIKKPLNDALLENKGPAIWIDDQLITPKGKYEVGANGKLKLVQDLSQRGFEKNLEQIESWKDREKSEGRLWGANKAAKELMETRGTERAAKAKEEAETKAKQERADAAERDRFTAYEAEVSAKELPRGKKQTVEIPMTDRAGKAVESRSVEMTAYGPIGIRKNEDFKGYKGQSKYIATHIPTGKGIQGGLELSTLDQAKRYVQTLLHSGVDFSKTELSTEESNKAISTIRAFSDRKTPDWWQPKVAAPDKVETFLDKAIEGLKTNRGQTYADPLFIQSVGKPALRVALQIVRAAYRAGKSAAQAIAEAMEYLRANVPNLDEAKAREWLDSLPKPEETAPPKPPVDLPKRPVGELPETTAAYNAATDRLLERGGFEPIAAPARKALGTSWDEARAQAAADPGRGSRLVAELNENPRTLVDDVESGVLLHELATRKAEQVAAQEALFAAAESGDEAAIGDAKARLQAARDATFEAITAAKLTGTAWGRAGRFRQLAIDKDYSLTAMEAQWRAEVNGGKPLNEDQAKLIAELHQKIADSEAKIAAFEAKESAAETKRIFDQMVTELMKQQKARKSILSSTISILESEGKKARARIRQRTKSTFALVDPVVVYDVAIIGAEKIAKGLSKFADWSKAMIDDLGDWLQPELSAMWEKSNDFYSQLEKAQQAKAAKRKAETSAAATTAAPATPESVLANDKAGEPLSPKVVYDLARAHVNAGVEGMEAVMEAVHADLLPNHPGLTVRDVRDAFSGYGKVTFPSREADRTALREYRTLARLTSQLEDAQNRLAPLKTGPQRDKASQAVRDLTKQVKETMRRLGIETTTPEQQLRTSLDAVKTRLRNQIEDLQKQIDTRTKPEGKTAIPYDEEATALRTERDRLAGIAEEIFGKPELTDEQRIAAATKALDRSIAEEDALLKQGILKRPRKDSKTPLTPELETKRAILAAMRGLRKELFDATNPKRTPEQIQLARDKKLIAKRTAELERRVREGDYGPKPKKDPVMDKEKEDLLFANAKAKAAFNRGLFEERQKLRSIPRKIYDTGREILNTSRAILTSFDLSAVFRQGGFIAFAHPVRAARSIVPMLRALGSEKAALKVNKDIKDRPNAPLYSSSKLFLSDQDSTSLTHLEEQFMSRFIQRSEMKPGESAKNAARRVKNLLTGPVRASARAYTTFLNKLRADSFDAMANTLGGGAALTPAEASAIANFVNVATGRGSLPGKAAQAAAGLNSIFFAPRYVLSRFQLLAGQPLYGGNARTRALIAGEYARYLGGIALVYALAMAAQDDDDEPIETDPTSSNFLKVRFGNTRLNPMSGLLQATVFASREANAIKRFVTQDESKEPKYGSGGDVLVRFLRSKLSPAVGTLVDALAGKDVTGQPVTPETAALRMVTPISMGDILKTMEEQGVPKGIALSILSILGMGVQTYEEKRRR